MIGSSIRTKLIVGFAVVVIVQTVITCLVGVHLFYSRTVSQAQSEVTAALNSAREIYSSNVRGIKHTVRLSATRLGIIEAMVAGDHQALALRLDRVRRAEGLDVLTLTDAQGRVVHRACNPGSFGDDRSTDLLVRAVLADPRPIWGTLIVTRDDLLKENSALAERVYIRFIETASEKPRARTTDCADCTDPAVVAKGYFGGVSLKRNPGRPRSLDRYGGKRQST